MATPSPKGFADLLQSAVHEPGTLSQAYRQFHSYSLGNQLLAWSQCLDREITPGPLATFRRWKALGRCVRKGQKAITLCQPITIKRKGVISRSRHWDHAIRTWLETYGYQAKRSKRKGTRQR